MGRRLTERKLCEVCGQTVETTHDGEEHGHGDHVAAPEPAGAEPEGVETEGAA